MLWLLFGRSEGFVAGISYKDQLLQNINLVPLFTIQNYLYILTHSQNRYMLVHCFINLAGNLLMFIPAGWLLPRIWKKLRNFFRFFTLCLGLIFLVETVQLFTLLGSFDIDDIILNLAGMVMGFILHALNRKNF